MGQLLGEVAVGTVLKLNESGSPQNYLVVHQGKPSSIYDESCNGTWLLRQDLIENRVWDDGNVNKLESSDIQPWLNSTMLGKYDANIQAAIKQVKIPYRKNGGSGGSDQTGANGLSCKVFLLSGYEVGWSTSDTANIPVDGAKLSYFESGTGSSANNKRIAKLNGSATEWWLRSPLTVDTSTVRYVYSDGSSSSWAAGLSYGVRPALVLPTDLLVDDSNNVTANQLVPPNSIIVPSIAMQQQSLPISWTPVVISGQDVTYQLQRNVGNGEWITIYTGADAFYTDTAGAWTQVQYQVAAVVLSAISSYTQSSIIPVSNPFALVISGSDGNLGTLTSNVHYTVSSNTGNPISLTRTVNGAQVVTLTVESGFAYNIPIADLPTGTGTIQITASVESSSKTVTQTRAWTYYKTPINIPSTGGIAQLTQNGQNIWPVTVPDAVEAPVYLGGNLNAALNKLGQAVLYTKIGSPKYNQVTVDLSKVKVGDEVLLPENGVMVPFYVGSLNYEPTLNTRGNRVLLIRKNVYQTGQWNSSNVNTYANSTVDTWLNGTYKNLLGQEIQDNIGITTFEYTPGNGNWTVTNLSRAVFLLSVTELGQSSEFVNTEGETLSIYNILQQIGGMGANQWTRSPDISNNSKSIFLFYNGSVNPVDANSLLSYRPCFTLPATFNQTYYVDSSNNIYPSQEYTQGGSITDVIGYDVPIAQTEIGTYVGTGTAGQSSPNTLTFSFEPKVVFISTKINSTNNTGIFIYDTNAIYFPTSYPTGGSYLATTWQGNQISWYYANATAQLNVSGRTYNYIAIG